MEKPDTITVTSVYYEEIRAEKADLYLSIRGSSFFTGSAAMEKAKEINELVNELRKAGVQNDEITLRGVQADSSTGILGRTTSATYLVRVHCPKADKLGDLLAIATSQKNVSLDQLVWRFPDDSGFRTKLSEACVSCARERADRIAVKLGIKILAVHSLREKWTDPGDEVARMWSLDDKALRARASSARSVDLGFSLVNTKRIGVEIEAEFRVSSYS